jgi:NAD(P)-dependent dehydrogenase (short-subunit alcohol dehydrogenase family)
MGRVVLVTGVSRYLGGRFAKILSADPAVERVIGVDVIPPPHDIEIIKLGTKRTYIIIYKFILTLTF